MFENVREKIASAVRPRSLDVGDVVKVPDSEAIGIDISPWEALEHPVGGLGHWATYVGSRFKVRPMLELDGAPGKPVKVAHVQHLDDVVVGEAVDLYYKTKGRKRR